MRLSLSLSVFVLLAGLALAQAPVSAPYVENFDNEAQCPTAPGSACPLVGDFTNSTTDDADWIANSGATFSAGTGPSGDNTSGSGTYLYFETSTPVVQGDVAEVASPFLDVSNTVNPQFSFWYHMLGEDIGFLTIDLNQRINEGADGVAAPGPGPQGAFLSLSASFNAAAAGDRIIVSGSGTIDGTYVVTSVIDDNGVNVTPNFPAPAGPVNFVHERRTNAAVPAFNDDLDLWQQLVVPLNPLLAPFGNGGSVQVIFRGIDGAGFTSDMAIDDFEFRDPPADDVSPIAITSPVAGPTGIICAGDYTVTADIRNFGSNPTAPFPVILLVDGAPVSAEVVNAPLAPNDVVTVTFPNLAFLAAGSRAITVSTGLGGDADPSNDTRVSVLEVSAVDAFPYSEDFEAGQGGWAIVGGNTSWAFGTPNQAVIVGAASGVNAFGTGNLNAQYGAFEQGSVVSPCFDMTSLQAPFVRLSVNWDAEFDWDGGNLQYSLDDGGSWVTIGAVGDPGNWYTDGSIDSVPGGSNNGWSGSTADVGGSGGWVTATHAIEELAGQPSVRFRMNFASDQIIFGDGIAFDDFEIFDPIVPFPGSAEDLVLETAVNGDAINLPGNEIKSAQLGDFLTIRTASPLGTYVGTPYALLADTYFTTAGPNTPINVGGFPEVHISVNGVVVVDGNDEVGAGGLQAVVGPNGSELTYSPLLPELSGVSILLQSLVLDSGAANGFFAITDGRVFEIQ